MPKLTPKLIDAIVAAINCGRIKLPDLSFDNTDDWVTVWALADSGSAADVASLDKHFPGAYRKKGKGKPGPNFATAGNGVLKNKGEFEIEFEDQGGHKRSLVFQDADVGMPILSISRRGKEGYRTYFDEDGGELVHKATGEVTPLIARTGVYFVKMRVPRDIVGKASEGFGRHAP